ncbi:class I SAM-dependent methyltransferase [Gramella lutea]|uniref:Class I SAM-dependent methyltransferase n=1 Tax=Christiangramia lutea TaxID=1607951 RepID=A0A9X1V4B0_9FLAO|nr:class I SAM-dependent methyltransferase [Christiangramia lutea]MCH4823446.1 class I SAM-dependent methyltransferase [Christiangramia lutea]
MDKNKDIFGMAIKAFYEDHDKTDIIVHSPDFDDDIIPVDYLFRDFSQMPEIEQEALELSKGNLLDVGCGAGSHSLYLQDKKNLKVLGLDTSPMAIEIARKRGVKNAVCRDFFKLKDNKYDTILMLMNGSGIIGKLDKLGNFFQHAKTLLTENGQILLDSSDLIYLFDEEITEDNHYYGELEYSVSYKGVKSDYFDWLYIDPELLKEKAEQNGFSCEIIKQGENYEFLACLRMK